MSSVLGEAEGLYSLSLRYAELCLAEGHSPVVEVMLLFRTIDQQWHQQCCSYGRSASSTHNELYSYCRSLSGRSSTGRSNSLGSKWPRGTGMCEHPLQLHLDHISLSVGDETPSSTNAVNNRKCIVSRDANSSTENSLCDADLALIAMTLEDLSRHGPLGLEVASLSLSRHQSLSGLSLRSLVTSWGRHLRHSRLVGLGLSEMCLSLSELSMITVPLSEVHPNGSVPLVLDLSKNPKLWAGGTGQSVASVLELLLAPPEAQMRSSPAGLALRYLSLSHTTPRTSPLVTHLCSPSLQNALRSLWSQLRELDLSHCAGFFTVEESPHCDGNVPLGLVEALSTSPCLARLDLSYCGISDELASVLFTNFAYHNAQLCWLNLRGNRLNDDSLGKAAELLRSGSQIEVLFLGNQRSHSTTTAVSRGASTPAGKDRHRHQHHHHHLPFLGSDRVLSLLLSAVSNASSISALQELDLSGITQLEPPLRAGNPKHGGQPVGVRSKSYLGKPSPHQRLYERGSASRPQATQRSETSEMVWDAFEQALLRSPSLRKIYMDFPSNSPRKGVVAYGGTHLQGRGQSSTDEKRVLFIEAVEQMVNRRNGALVPLQVIEGFGASSSSFLDSVFRRHSADSTDTDRISLTGKPCRSGSAERRRAASTGEPSTRKPSPPTYDAQGTTAGADDSPSPLPAVVEPTPFHRTSAVGGDHGKRDGPDSLSATTSVESPSLRPGVPVLIVAQELSTRSASTSTRETSSKATETERPADEDAQDDLMPSSRRKDGGRSTPPTNDASSEQEQAVEDKEDEERNMTHIETACHPAPQVAVSAPEGESHESGNALATELCFDIREAFLDLWLDYRSQAGTLFEESLHEMLRGNRSSTTQVPPGAEQSEPAPIPPMVVDAAEATPESKSEEAEEAEGTHEDKRCEEASDEQEREEEVDEAEKERETVPVPTPRHGRPLSPVQWDTSETVETNETQGEPVHTTEPRSTETSKENLSNTPAEREEEGEEEDSAEAVKRDGEEGENSNISSEQKEAGAVTAVMKDKEKPPPMDSFDDGRDGEVRIVDEPEQSPREREPPQTSPANLGETQTPHRHPLPGKEEQEVPVGRSASPPSLSTILLRPLEYVCCEYPMFGSVVSQLSPHEVSVLYEVWSRDRRRLLQGEGGETGGVSPSLLSPTGRKFSLLRDLVEGSFDRHFFDTVLPLPFEAEGEVPLSPEELRQRVLEVQHDEEFVNASSYEGQRKEELERYMVKVSELVREVVMRQPLDTLLEEFPRLAEAVERMSVAERESFVRSWALRFVARRHCHKHHHHHRQGSTSSTSPPPLDLSALLLSVGGAPKEPHEDEEDVHCCTPPPALLPSLPPQMEGPGSRFEELARVLLVCHGNGLFSS